MDEQLVLPEVDERFRRPRPGAVGPSGQRARRTGGRRPAGREWQLDAHTVAVGRRGLEEARRALRRVDPTAA